jgi:hypothetical protein
VGGGPDRAFVGDTFADFAKFLGSVYLSLNGIPGLDIPGISGPPSTFGNVGAIRNAKDYFDYIGNKDDLNQYYQLPEDRVAGNVERAAEPEYGLTSLVKRQR